MSQLIISVIEISDKSGNKMSDENPFDKIEQWKANISLDKSSIVFGHVIKGCPPNTAWTILFSDDFDKYYTFTNKGVGETKELSVKDKDVLDPKGGSILFVRERRVLITPTIGLFGDFLVGLYKKYVNNDPISYETLQYKYKDTRSHSKFQIQENWMDFINTPTNLGSLAVINNWGTISLRPLREEEKATYLKKEDDQVNCCIMKTELYTASDFGQIGKMLSAHKKFETMMEKSTKEVFEKMLQSVTVYYEEYYLKNRKFLENKLDV